VVCTVTWGSPWVFLPLAIYAVGNLPVFKGPDDCCFCVRLYWTGFGLPANIVLILRIIVGLKCTWALVKSSGLSELNLAISGLMLMTFMAIHLFQLRFDDTDQFGHPAAASPVVSRSA